MFETIELEKKIEIIHLVARQRKPMKFWLLFHPAYSMEPSADLLFPSFFLEFANFFVNKCDQQVRSTASN